MTALILYHGEQNEWEARLPAQTVLRVVRVPRGAGLRARLAARAAARRLCDAGVRRAVFPPDYPFREAFASRGIAAPPLAPLYRASAPAIVRRCMEQMGLAARRAEVMVCAQAVSPELRAFAFELCREVRYLSVMAPRGGEELMRELRRERGVAPRFRPDLTVSFDGAAADGSVLRLDETLRVRYDSPLPNAVLAALWSAGALDARALRVCAVSKEADLS